MIDFSTLQSLTIPEGVVTRIEKGGMVLWELQIGESIVIEVEKITSNTYVGSVTSTNEEFILLDIYPHSGGKVTVTYGGMTKTIVDDGTSEIPNAQQVFFGTFGGVTDELATPTRGQLRISGDCRGFGSGSYKTASKSDSSYYDGFINVECFGAVDEIPNRAFYNSTKLTLTLQELPSSITSIGDYAFYHCGEISISEIPEGVEHIGSHSFAMNSNGGEVVTKMTNMTFPSTIKSIGDLAFTYVPGNGNYQNYCYFDSITILATTPPIITADTFGNGGFNIFVPYGCGEAYKAAEGWSTYAYYIQEVSE